MINVRVDKEIEEKLINIAKEYNKTKSDVVKEAIKTYLNKFEEERQRKIKEALDYFENNSINTNIDNIKAIQRIKSEKDIS